MPAWRVSPALQPVHVRLMDALIAQHPDMLSREELAAATEYSVKSSGFEKAVSRLSAIGLAVYPQQGWVAAGPLLFPEGLA